MTEPSVSGRQLLGGGVNVHRIDLPWPRPPVGLSGNSRVHWRAEHRAKADARQIVTLLARQAHIPPAEHLTVELFWAPGDRRERDEDNLWKLLKVCCDCLARGRSDFVGLDLVPNDTRKYMTKPTPRILSPDETAERGMWLLVTPSTLSSAPTLSAVRSQP